MSVIGRRPVLAAGLVASVAAVPPGVKASGGDGPVGLVCMIQLRLQPGLQVELDAHLRDLLALSERMGAARVDAFAPLDESSDPALILLRFPNLAAYELFSARLDLAFSGGGPSPLVAVEARSFLTLI